MTKPQEAKQKYTANLSAIQYYNYSSKAINLFNIILIVLSSLSQ